MAERASVVPSFPFVCPSNWSLVLEHVQKQSKAGEVVAGNRQVEQRISVSKRVIGGDGFE